jgi:archaellum biogenesis ATPase FlaH
MSVLSPLDIALRWHAWGEKVLPVIFRRKKSGEGWDKIPLVDYAHWKNGTPQTVEEIRNMQTKDGRSAWDVAEGVAILLWPTGRRVVVDLDGDGAGELLVEAGIKIPETGIMHTRSGGLHYHFTVPVGTPRPDADAPDRDKRVIRLLSRTDATGKPCKPAVDLLFNGIVVVAGPNYRADPDHPVDLEHLAEIPPSIMALAREKNRPASGSPSTARPQTEYAEMLRGVPGGIQHDTSVKLIGHLLTKLPAAEVENIMDGWCDRCDPPADKRKVRANLKDLTAKESAKGKGEGNTRRLQLVTVTDLLSRDYADRVDIIGGGILPPEGGLLLAGPSGAGKSLLSLELALDLANVKPFLGLFAVAAAQSVLVIQQENAQAEVQKRLARMIEARDWTSLVGGLTVNEPGSFLDLEDKADWDAIAAAIEEAKATVLILDPLSTFHGRDENDNTRMRKVLDRVTGLCRQAHCAAMVLHHFGKPQAGQNAEDTRHGIRGASSILDWADTAITLTEKKHEELILRRLEFVKIRNGKPIRPLLLQRDPENLLHTVVAEEGVLCSPARVAAILRDLGGEVESKSALVSEIMKQTGASQATAYRVVDEVIREKLIRVAAGEGRKTRLEAA